MDVFAADLWDVHNGRGPDEYKDKTLFFRKTYETEGLKNLLSIVGQRLNGRGGDPVIQLQTPFGGGKTHALIAMYHRAAEWGAKRVVIVGTAMDPSDTLWGVLEKQLTGKIERFSGLTAPGGDALRTLIEEQQPVLILMDEVLQYVTKAAGVVVGGGTLADQTIAFMQELTEIPGKLERAALVVALPSSASEHFGADAEKLFKQLKDVSGRVEKIYTPVQDHEIAQVIRQRLFSNIDTQNSKEIINGFLDYASKEEILPAGSEPSEYRKRFETAYPFLPEVVDVLYQRWGSFPEFQRTRGVLRLLSLVIYSLKDTSTPYISLADFDLDDQEIRQELIKHIGQPFDSVIAMDITGVDSGAKKIDVALGDAFRGMRLGTRAATTIFLYSFSGGLEQGADVREIKRSATTIDNPASVVAEAVEQFRSKLTHLHHEGDKYHFTNQPNLNQLALTKMENISTQQVEEFQYQLFRQNVGGGPLTAYIWPRESSAIPETEGFKLVILKSLDDTLMRDILQTKGNSPRVNRNTLFFLTPLSIEQASSYDILKRHLAYCAIRDDRTVNLSDEQKGEVKKQVEKSAEDATEALRRYYRLLFVPGKDEFKEIDLGIPTYGESTRISQEVYRKLQDEKEILTRIGPEVIKLKYLSEREFVPTLQLYTASLTTPGEIRFRNQEVLTDGISEGVALGMFGLGEIRDEQPICTHFKEDVPALLISKEVIIRGELCVMEEPPDHCIIEEGADQGVGEQGGSKQQQLLNQESELVPETLLTEINLRFPIPPRGHFSDITAVMQSLQERFKDISITLRARDGEISEEDFDEEVRDAFRRLRIELEEGR
jgi:RNase H-fold protein (predicted Holliday junction resolvase)